MKTRLSLLAIGFVGSVDGSSCLDKTFNGNGTYDPLAGDQVVDMGIRGLIPIKQ